MVKRILAAVLAMMILLGCAVAEEAELGNFPSRGVLLQLKQEDLDMGLDVGPFMHNITVDGKDVYIPGLAFLYTAPEATQALEDQFAEMLETGNFDAYADVVAEYYFRSYGYARIFLVSDESIVAAADEVFGDAEITLMGENDGYTYLLATYDETISEKDDPAIVEAGRERVVEMLNTLQYQPVVIPEEEMEGERETVVLNTFPTFTTQDLNGNTVDNSLFAKADLTVLNIWGTTCFPCITEMPELQAWSNEMPENVQMVGLVLDVIPGNDEFIEMAQMICESTGVTYTNLMLSEDLYEFATGIIFTPTTIFVDSNGSIVGDPITGAKVDAYKTFVESYLAR